VGKTKGGPKEPELGLGPILYSPFFKERKGKKVLGRGERKPGFPGFLEGNSFPQKVLPRGKIIIPGETRNPLIPF